MDERKSQKQKEQLRGYRKDQKKQLQLAHAVGLSNPKATGQLNPTWVEWLMGFPTGYTELNPSETQ